MKILNLIIILLFIIGFIILFQQSFTGEFFDVKDIHHETFALLFFGFAFGLLIGKRKKRNEKEERKN